MTSDKLHKRIDILKRSLDMNHDFIHCGKFLVENQRLKVPHLLIFPGELRVNGSEVEALIVHILNSSSEIILKLNVNASEIAIIPVVKHV